MIALSLPLLSDNAQGSHCVNSYAWYTYDFCGAELPCWTSTTTACGCVPSGSRGIYKCWCTKTSSSVPKTDGTPCGRYSYTCGPIRSRSTCYTTDWGTCLSGTCVNPPPTMGASHSPPSPTTANTVTITGTASGPVGITSLTLFLDGSLIQTCASSPCTRSTGPYPSGSHTYYSKAIDTYGRTATSSTQTFTVISLCDNDLICEAGETPANCASDCSDFSLSLNPANGTAKQGGSASTQAVLTRIAGSGTVTLANPSPARGISVSFAPSNCSPPCASNVDIVTDSNAALGANSIIIRGSSGPVQKDQTFNLILEESSGEEVWKGCGKIKVGLPTEVKSPSKSLATKSGRTIQLEIEVNGTRCAPMDAEIFLKRAPPSDWDYKFTCGASECGSLKEGRTIILRPADLSAIRTLNVTFSIPTHASPGKYQVSLSGRKI